MVEVSKSNEIKWCNWAVGLKSGSFLCFLNAKKRRLSHSVRAFFAAAGDEASLAAFSARLKLVLVEDVSGEAGMTDVRRVKQREQEQGERKACKGT